MGPDSGSCCATGRQKDQWCFASRCSARRWSPCQWSDRKGAGFQDGAARRVRLIADRCSVGELCAATWQRSTGFSSRLPLGLCWQWVSLEFTLPLNESSPHPLDQWELMDWISGGGGPLFCFLVCLFCICCCARCFIYSASLLLCGCACMRGCAALLREVTGLEMTVLPLPKDRPRFHGTSDFHQKLPSTAKAQGRVDESIHNRWVTIKSSAVKNQTPPRSQRESGSKANEKIQSGANDGNNIAESSPSSVHFTHYWSAARR